MTSGDLPIGFKECIEYTLNQLRRTERSQHISSWTWKLNVSNYVHFDRLCPKISMDIATTKGPSPHDFTKSLEIFPKSGQVFAVM